MEKSGKRSEHKTEFAWLIAFGDAVSDSREQRNMTQQDLADESGVNRTYISDIERGRRNITVFTLKRIATALGIGPSELILKADETSQSASFLRRIKKA